MNSIRTILALIATALVGVMGFLPQVLGCVEDVTTHHYDCTGSWLPPEWVGVVASVLYIAALIMKAFGQGGSVMQNLFNRSVVVTPGEVKPGTVTPAQVDSGVK